MEIELKFNDERHDIIQKIEETYYEKEEIESTRFTTIDIQGFIKVYHFNDLESVRVTHSPPDPADKKKSDAILNLYNDLLAFLTYSKQGMIIMQQFILTHPTTWKAIKEHTKEIKDSD